MPQLRQDPATKEWVIIATERSKRPDDFNYVIHTAPVKDEQEDYYHWHLQVIPRLTTPAGFEMGSGIFINVSFPEETAQFLREE